MRIDNRAEHMDVAADRTSVVYYADGYMNYRTSSVVQEHFMDLMINEQLAVKLVCTPRNLVELVVGRLITEAYIRNLEEVDMCYICEQGRRAKVFLAEDTGLVSVVQQEPTCCTGNQVLLKTAAENQLNPLLSYKWKKEWIFDLAKGMVLDNEIHKMTQGTHGCYLSVNGKIRFRCEDIGRHNALDKAIGYAVMHGYRGEDCMLYTTGRVPTDMVRKVVTAGIPILVSKSVPTKEAISMAKYYGLTLICRAWPDKFEVFASP